jgi:Flp pilus assembly protein TadG
MKAYNSKRGGYIDQILMFTIIFVNFVFLFFLVIDYANTSRIKANTHTIAHYGARMIGLGYGTTTIAEGMNNLKIDYFATINAADITCDTLVSNNRQSIFIVNATYDNQLILSGVSDIQTKQVAYNQESAADEECTLTLTNTP